MRTAGRPGRCGFHAARLIAIGLLAGQLLACQAGVPQPAPTSPTPTPTSATITGLAISGLPDPLLSSIPSWLDVGQTYALTAQATFADGSTAPIKEGGVTWRSSDPSVASFDGSVLTAHREGAVTITLSVAGNQVPAVSRDVAVITAGRIVLEERSEFIPITECGRRPCPYSWCPETGPYWLFPVHTSGTIELISVRNPGWGSPSNYVTQLSPKGEYIRSWLLLPGNEEFRRAVVPGGYMYVFTMSADACVWGDVSAVWTHPE